MPIRFLKDPLPILAFMLPADPLCAPLGKEHRKPVKELAEDLGRHALHLGQFDQLVKAGIGTDILDYPGPEQDKVALSIPIYGRDLLPGHQPSGQQATV
jgi:hypothetical protein